MADKSLPDQKLPERPTGREGEDRRIAERRLVLSRAAIGLPVILGTVYGRTAWAQPAQPSSAASANPSARP